MPKGILIPVIAVIDHKRKELAGLCVKHRVRCLALFGSAVGDDFDSANSDLDFLVQFYDMPPREHTEHYFGLMEDLEDLFRFSIDLTEEEPIDNPYFRQAVENSKVILYNAA